MLSNGYSISSISITSLSLVVFDVTTKDIATFVLAPGISLTSGGTNASVTLRGTPAWTMTCNTGGGGVASLTTSSVSLTADTTNGGINLSVTESSTDTLHILADVQYMELR